MRRFLLRNWRVWHRLVALILVPTAVAAVLCVQEFRDAGAEADRYHRTEELVRLSGVVATLGYELAAERGLSNGYIASGRSRADLFELVRDQRLKTDTAAAEVRRLAARADLASSGAFGYRVETVLGLVDTIEIHRESVAAKTPALTVFTGYTALIGELLSFLDAIEQSGGDPELGRGQRNLRALALAAENAGQQRGMLNGVLRRGSGIRGEELTVVLVARQQHLDRVSDFKLAADGDEIRLYDETVTGAEVARAYDILREVIEAVQQAFSRSGDITRLNRVFRENADDWFAVMTVLVDRIHLVETEIVKDLVAYSEHEAEVAEAARLRLGGLLSAVMLLVLGFTLVIARSLVRPLRVLREGALDVATVRLPETVRRLREDGPRPEEPLESVAETSVTPLAVRGTDEIGQVARAFDEVHREAVRLAAEEARLRGDVNAMFVNLSRRSQTLIELQLRMIERLEDDEPDADRLGQLFRLDHLATRMRRNAESLLVLGGVEQVRRAQRPVALIDVVRAALSEVEQYARVRPRLQDGVVIAGPVVGDLVHLLAELIENALTFSPETTRVEVTGQLMSDRSAVVQIIDHGVGMTDEELREANHRLRSPRDTEFADVSVARRMGLFVVGRLADRHGIRVELRPVEFGGVGVLIVLPPTSLARPDTPPGTLPSSTPAPVPIGDPGPGPAGLVPAGLASAGPAPGPGPGLAGAGSAGPVDPAGSPEDPERPQPQNGRLQNGQFQDAERSQPQNGRLQDVERAQSQDGRVQDVERSQSQDEWLQGVERSPIFEAVESEWFHRGVAGAGEWQEADPRWELAERVSREPTVGGRTDKGLPKRVPGANRVRGSAFAAPVAEAGPVRSAEAVAARLGSLQRGVREGRHSSETREP